MRGWNAGWMAMVVALGMGCPGPDPLVEDPEELPETGPTISVRGFVKTYQGHGIGGYWAVVVDANGKRTETRTAEDGAFTALEVKPPYSLSAVPLGDLKSNKTALTFAGVTRSDPTLVIHDSGRAPACTTIPKVVVTGDLASPVPAGHAATVTVMARGSDPVPLWAFKSAGLTAGETTFHVEVPFRSLPCMPEIRADVIHVETDGVGQVVRSQLKEVMLTGMEDSVSVALTEPQSGAATIAGRVKFPEGVAQAAVFLHFKVGNNYARFKSVDITPESNSFNFSVPVREGLTYVVETNNGNRFAFSAPLAPNATIELTLPEHPSVISPVGLADAPTPTFVREPGKVANAYLTLVRQKGANIWTGISASPEITMPALPGGAALDPSAEHNWVDFYTLELATGVSIDDLLDGRLVRQPTYLDWRYAPDLVKSGSRKTASTVFYLP